MNWRKPAKRFLSLLNNLCSYIAVLLIKLYQLLLSPYLGRSCRFAPTCSQYAINSFKNFNFIMAFYLTIKRLLKCHPLGSHGYDPVPQSHSIKGRS